MMLMRAFFLPLLFTAVASALRGAPVNDLFASATLLTGATVAVPGTNVGATTQAGENTRNGVLGATVWYAWQAPASGWVRVDTLGSVLDTVVQVFTGPALASLTSAGWNDEAPNEAGVSSVTFMATAGTTYRISVGGYDPFAGAEEGSFSLNIKSGAAGRPAYWPGTVAVNPASVDVTAAAAPVSVGVVIQSVYTMGTGTVELGMDWTADEQSRTFGQAAAWDLSLPQGGAPGFNFSVPRYFAPGAHALGLRITASEGDAYVFGGPDSGLPYVLPPPPGSARVLSVTNTGPVDEDAPVLVSLSVAASVDVTAGGVGVPVTAVLQDQTAGVAWVRVELTHPGSVRPLSVALSRTAGTALNGTWTGTLQVPRFYPTENYTVLLETADAAGNAAEYGTGGTREIPGGNVSTGITGGGVYEVWAWSEWFAPGDVLTGPNEDADGDGRVNLLSYAFGLNPLDFPASAGALPVVSMTGTGSDRRLRIVWRQRKASTLSGLTYTPQFTSGLSGVWQDGGRNRIVSSVDAVWEEITVEDTVAVAGSVRRFARVRVELDDTP